VAGNLNLDNVKTPHIFGNDWSFQWTAYKKLMRIFPEKTCAWFSKKKKRHVTSNNHIAATTPQFETLILLTLIPARSTPFWQHESCFRSFTQLYDSQQGHAARKMTSTKIWVSKVTKRIKSTLLLHNSNNNSLQHSILLHFCKSDCWKALSQHISDLKTKVLINKNAITLQYLS
jgi:hypothetical protein